MRKRLVKFILPRMLKRVAPMLIRILGKTLRYQCEDRAGLLTDGNRSPVLFCFWHNRILLMPYIYQLHGGGRKLAVMMSGSRDGSFIAEIAAQFGIEAIRGSTSKGAVGAALKIHRLLRQNGGDFALTPDGPRGPVYRFQHGILTLSRKTGMPIVPLRIEYEKKWELRSWDRFQIPRPFTRCRFIIQPPVAAGDRPNEELEPELCALMGVGPDGALTPESRPLAW